MADFQYIPLMRIRMYVAALCGIMGGVSVGSGQTTADCEGAIVLCGDWYSEENASFSTGDVFEYTGECNAGTEYPSVWYTFTVQESGYLSFILTPNQVADDYDWAVFDITDGGCEGIGPGGASPEVECNSFGEFGDNGATGMSSAMGGTGSSIGPGNLNGPAFNADLPVVAGSTYALVVMNWTQSPYGYTLDFGFSTASLYDGVPPGIADVEVPCDASELLVTLTEPVLLSTVEVADFALFGPGAVEVDLAPIVPINPSGELCSTFLLTPSDPLAQSGAYNLMFTEVAGSVEDPCGNLGTGQFDLMIDVLTPPVGWGQVDVMHCEGEPVVLHVEGGAEQPAGQEYTWNWYADAGGGMSPEWLAEGGAWLVEEDGLYEVVLETVPPCFSAAGAFYVMAEDCGLFIPNAITPGNGDAVNNAFRVDGLDNWPRSRVTIWNRWGDAVFEHGDFGTSAGWSPSVDGPVAASEGTYFYQLVIPRDGEPVQVEDAHGTRVETGNGDLVLTGTITVLR